MLRFDFAGCPPCLASARLLHLLHCVEVILGDYRRGNAFGTLTAVAGSLMARLLATMVPQ